MPAHDQEASSNRSYIYACAHTHKNTNTHTHTHTHTHRKCSPFYHADKIVKPLLIAQGANDPRVKKAESDQMVSAMHKAGTAGTPTTIYVWT